MEKMEVADVQIIDQLLKTVINNHHHNNNNNNNEIPLQKQFTSPPPELINYELIEKVQRQQQQKQQQQQQKQQQQHLFRPPPPEGAISFGKNRYFQNRQQIINETAAETTHQKEEESSTTINKSKNDYSSMTTEERKEFNAFVMELLELENKIKELSEELKRMNKEKALKRTKLLETMIKYDSEVTLSLPDGGNFKIINNTKQLNPLTKKRLPLNLSKYFMQKENINQQQADKKSDDILKFIFAHTETTNTQTLRRSK